MQSEWSVAQEPMPRWLENLEDQASAARLELEREQSEARLAELESLLEELPGIFERKFQQRLEPVLDRQQLLIDENERLRALVERLMPQPGEVRLRFPDRRPPPGPGQRRAGPPAAAAAAHPRWAASRRRAAAQRRVGRPHT